MATTDVSVSESGELGLVLQDSEWGILIDDVKDGILTQRYPEVAPGLLLTKVRGQDVSLESGKTKADAVELLGDKKQRPLDLQVKVLVKKPKETVVVLRSEGPLGMVLHDSPLGARVDHISSGVVRREAPHVRIGLVLIKVNDEDVSMESGAKVEDIIPLLLDSPRPMILTFIRPGTEEHDDDHHDFVINPTAKKSKGVDVVVDIDEMPRPSDDGPKSIAYVNCQAFLDVKSYVTLHFVYEVGMIVSAVFTSDISKSVSVLVALASGNIVGKVFAYHKADSVKFYMIASVIATAIGIGLAGYMLWYLVDYCEEPEPRPGGPEWDSVNKTWGPPYLTVQTQVHTNLGTNDDPNWQFVTVEEPKPRECKVGPELKIFVLATALADVFLRSVGILKSTLKIQYIIDWWDEKETTEFEAAQRVQAIVRGNQGRKRLRAEKGIVTRALAGDKYKAHMYRPATPIELRVQKTMKALWDRKAGGKAKLRTFHSIRAQASQNHRVFQKLKAAFTEYDLDGNGTIELAEAEAALRDMGAVITEQEMEFLFMESFAPPAQKFAPHRVGVKDQHRKREGDRVMPWEKREIEEGEDVLCGPSGKPWPEPLQAPPELEFGTVDKTVNKILPNMSEQLPEPAELKTWTKESQLLFWQQRDKFWNRWSHEELQQSCLDHGLHPDGAMRFLKDRMMRYDFGRVSLTADETSTDHGWELNEDETAWVYTKQDEPEPEPEPEGVEADKKKKGKEEEEEESKPDPNLPKVGDIVVLTHAAASTNMNNVLKLGILQPQETGVVLEYDPNSTRMHFEVKNNTKGSANFGKTAWYQDATVMKASLVGASDEPDELSEFIMTEEEMAWAKNTMTPDELAQTLSGGLDMNHFLVMLAVGFLLKVIPGKVRARNKAAFDEYAEAFNCAIDAFIQLDEGYGVIILQGVEVKLKEAKAGDMVTVEKLASIDEKKSGYVAFGHFLTGFFKWMDPELDDI